MSTIKISSSFGTKLVEPCTLVECSEIPEVNDEVLSGFVPEDEVE